MRCFIFRSDQTGAKKFSLACNKSVRKIYLKSRLWINSIMFCDFICCSFVFLFLFLFRRHCSWHFSWSKIKKKKWKKNWNGLSSEMSWKLDGIENAMAMTGFGSFFFFLSLWSQWVMVGIRARRLRLHICCARLQVNEAFSNNKSILLSTLKLRGIF